MTTIETLIFTTKILENIRNYLRDCNILEMATTIKDGNNILTVDSCFAEIQLAIWKKIEEEDNLLRKQTNTERQLPNLE